MPLAGFGPDTMVTIEVDEDAFTIVKGVDGDVTRSKTLGQTALITVMLMSSSPSNGVLSAAHSLDQKSAGGAGIAPLMIRDRNGTSVFATDKAWVEKMPTVSRGKQAAAQEWKIRAVGFEFFEGGSGEV